MRTRPCLILEDDGDITLAVPDFDEADAIAAETGLGHEDGYFDLGHVDDYALMRHPSLERLYRGQWLSLGRTWEADQADRRRPETFTVAPYCDVRRFA